MIRLCAALMVCLMIMIGVSWDKYHPPKIHIIGGGAICHSGAISTATGRGACSHHGGVKKWVRNERKN